MNKDDILKKSRAENRNGDEREEKIRLHSYAMSAAIGGLLCMICVLIENGIFNRSTTLIWTIYTGMMFSQKLLNSIKLKKRFDIVLSVIWGLCCVINAVAYILSNIG